ncbi:transcriptional regulator [Duganella sp. BJB1802]|uniref:helix-turn-helix transcriptional regulator n=1 Tax=Duganella sp. BJB1802 TaxID=2744575 RepID=UPI001593FF20|nr:transcriptional regulator [Duganella sp. BJB1802]NVD74537.1 transcriptional regulator [Duganella sp. BJB1802]
MAAQTVAAAAAAPALPPVGMSRWQQLQHIIPVSREKWRQLCLVGRAPAPIRISERCTMYPNIEVHRWLADPIGYRQVKGGAA